MRSPVAQQGRPEHEQRDPELASGLGGRRADHRLQGHEQDDSRHGERDLRGAVDCPLDDPAGAGAERAVQRPGHRRRRLPPGKRRVADAVPARRQRPPDGSGPERPGRGWTRRAAQLGSLERQRRRGRLQDLPGRRLDGPSHQLPPRSTSRASPTVSPRSSRSQATDTAGNPSAPSAPRSATTKDLTAPTWPASGAFSGTAQSGTVTLRWPAASDKIGVSVYQS